MGELIAAVDEVHCLTSLAGFEALLREKRVVTYGQPFYAGWGLTIDRNPPSRRGRRLSLEQLVAGTLLHYARYFDPLTKLPCPAEVLIARFDNTELWRPSPLVRLRRFEGRIVYLLRAIGRLCTTKVVHQETP
jgi:capsular polysaccharide export protein